MARLVFILVALQVLAGCSPRVARAEPQAVTSTFAQSLGEYRDWELAFVRDGHLWSSRLSGEAKLVARHADSPVWSPDGRSLAYRQGSTLQIRNFESGRTWTVAEDRAFLESRPSGFPEDPLQMTFDPIRPVLVVATGPGLRLYSLVGNGASPFGDILTHRNWSEYAPAWSQSGSKLAFARSGDIWVALRDVERWKTSIPVDGGRVDLGGFTVDYYDDARRLAPLAVWNDGESGVSARTPMWVDGLAWTADEKRLVFHFQRHGGSGISEIGYLELEPGDEDLAWEAQSGFRVQVNWLKTQHDLLFQPAIAPDGKTLSFLAEDKLYLSDWGRDEVEVFANVDEYAWRPQKRD